MDTMTNFAFLTGDLNWQEYGGLWYRRIAPKVYHVIELINLIDAIGEEAESTYGVELQEIDLIGITSAQLDSALSCCGARELYERQDKESTRELLAVESLSVYGLFAPMGRWAGNAYASLLKTAKEESRHLTNSYNYRRAQLARPVNKIGSTATEFARGDLDSALERGIAKGDKTALLVAKIKGWKV